MGPVTPGVQGGNANKTPSASVAAVAIEFPPHRVGQREALSGLTNFGGPQFDRFGASAGVENRRISLPLSQYGQLSGFTEANEIFVQTALDLGERALLSALDSAKVRPSDVDIIFSTTVTGLAVPTLEARLANRVGLRADVKRVPLFGLGCVAGAAGVARMHDYLLAFPDHVAVLLAVELCSLTLQRNDFSVANLVATSLFGDGAGAIVAKGSALAPMGPRVLATRSRLYPDTEEVMGWNIGSNGFQIKLSTEVATVAEKYLGEDVRNFLADYGLTPADVSTWVCHPGGPKVI
jgi:alkylresorcinol/alkylpyrone synthase